MEALASQVSRRFRNAKTHDKSPTVATGNGHHLLPTHERFVCVVKCASQLRTSTDPNIFAMHRRKRKSTSSRRTTTKKR